MSQDNSIHEANVHSIHRDGSFSLLTSSSYQPHGCRWGWCRFTCSSQAELVNHVIHDHVKNSVPVMRRDISILRRAEEGQGASLSVSEIVTELSGETTTDQGVTVEDRMSGSIEVIVDITHPLSVYSPLPSTPMTPSMSIPAPEISSNDNSLGKDSQVIIASSLADTQTMIIAESLPNPTTPRSRHINNSFVPRLSDPPQNTNNTPTFASLSSPLGSPSIPSLPASPSFHSLINHAVKGFHVGDGTDLGPVNSLDHSDAFGLVSQNPYSSQSDSQSSSKSRDLVEQQLTQSVEMDPNADNDMDAVGEPDVNIIVGSEQDIPEISRAGADVHSEHLPSLIRGSSDESQSHPISHPTIQTRETVPFDQIHRQPSLAKGLHRIPRQAWYQSPNPRSIRAANKNQHRTASSKSDSPIDNRSSSHGQLPNQIKPQPNGNLDQNSLRSEFIQIGPRLNQGQNVVQSHKEVDRLLSRSQQSTSSNGSSQIFSYPALQTQAPYHSQSLSQT